MLKAMVDDLCRNTEQRLAMQGRRKLFKVVAGRVWDEHVDVRLSASRQGPKDPE